MIATDRATELGRVTAAIRAGGVAAYPTETYYALGADPRNAAALDRLTELKNREPDKPFLLIVGSLDELQKWTVDVPPQMRLIAERFWPGPLTVVLRAREGLHAALVGPECTIAFRLSPHPSARSLVDRCGGALTGTSANRAGEAPPRTATQVRQAFSLEEVTEILDGGRTPGGKPSTLVDLTKDPARILRPGAVSNEQIADTIRLL